MRCCLRRATSAPSPRPGLGQSSRDASCASKLRLHIAEGAISSGFRQQRSEWEGITWSFTWPQHSYFPRPQPWLQVHGRARISMMLVSEHQALWPVTWLDGSTNGRRITRAIWKARRSMARRGSAWAATSPPIKWRQLTANISLNIRMRCRKVQMNCWQRLWAKHFHVSNNALLRCFWHLMEACSHAAAFPLRLRPLRQIRPRSKTPRRWLSAANLICIDAARSLRPIPAVALRWGRGSTISATRSNRHYQRGSCQSAFSQMANVAWEIRCLSPVCDRVGSSRSSSAMRARFRPTRSASAGWLSRWFLRAASSCLPNDWKTVVIIRNSATYSTNGRNSVRGRLDWLRPSARW